MSPISKGRVDFRPVRSTQLALAAGVLDKLERTRVLEGDGVSERSESYALPVRALLEDGPLKGKAVEIEAVEGRPPMTVDLPDEKGGTARYCLGDLTQEGHTATYTFLYAV